jgi:hypothetical protein
MSGEMQRMHENMRPHFQIQRAGHPELPMFAEPDTGVRPGCDGI